MGVYYPLLALPHDRHLLDCLSPIPYPLCIHILPHSFALIKTQLFSFQAIPHCASKNGPRWGIPTDAHEDQNESGKD